ncbi:MAG: hypothetical protein LC122_05065 [Chitinophagales bacterium]|nr:hypothetical protein [Chitinophagales bacterium]
MIQWIVPVFLRKPLITLFVLAANKSLRTTYNYFKNYEEEINYRLNHNYQVCYLRALLNDKFDVTLRRIEIVDFSVYGALWLFDDADFKDINLGDDNVQYVYPDDTGYDFTIRIPNSIVQSEAEIALLKANANVYKLAGKQFYIERF